jgi:murein tripeptide amidase MpaA
MGYLSSASIEWCLQYLASAFPTICQVIVQPDTSIEGRTIRAIKIADGEGEDRRGVLLIGGVHAREIVNPDLLVRFAYYLCRAYTTGTGLTFEGKEYSKEAVELIVKGLDLFVLPLVNPDGRAYVLSPTGDPWWRKNRNPNPGLPCEGIDLNRNYDFLWSSGIGTSSSSCSSTYKGSGEFSEPETSNVRYMLDQYPNICCMVDIHSYSELILYPWGDDDTQTTDPTMNFANAAFDGLRGTLGDTLYREYMPPADLDWYVATGNRVRDAIAAVNGNVYTVQASVSLYPTTGTSDDYAYGRHIVGAGKRRVLAYVFETGTEFQPPWDVAFQIIKEVCAGLVEFCLACLCVAEETVRGTELQLELAAMREFRSKDLVSTPAGRTYVRLLDQHTPELLSLVRREPGLRKRAASLLKPVLKVVRSRKDEQPQVFEREVIEAAGELLEKGDAYASPALRETIELLRRDLNCFEGRTVMEGLEAASEGY